MVEMNQQKREAIIIENHDYFHNCHASTIVSLPNGELLVAYFAGTREGSGDMAIWLSRKSGEVWEAPQRTIFQEGLPHWNPVLHTDGQKVWLFYKVGKTVPTWRTMVTVSEDGGRSWQEPRELAVGDHLPRGPVKNKLLVLTNGTWIAGSSIEGEAHWDCFADYSSDQGLTWSMREIPFEHVDPRQDQGTAIWEGLKTDALWENDLEKVFQWDGVIQPTLWESKPGHVHMLMRSTRGRIYRSDSIDYGRTWCTAYPSELPNNNSGIDVVRLENGKLALVYNPVSGNWSARSPISISFSEDNGFTWTQPYHFETEDGEFSYPAIICLNDEIHITYTWNRKNIIHHHLKLLY